MAYKIILIGDPRVGKTSIRKKYMGEGFKGNYMVTLGADFAIKRLDKDVMQIWDLAGQPVYQSVRSSYYGGAEGIILVFDITSRETFYNCAKWLNEVVSNLDYLIPLILVGNKNDLRSGNSPDEISPQEGENYAKELSKWSGFDVGYIETSALTGLNIDNIFDLLKSEIDNSKSAQLGN
ncbi:MAG: Rab family GTPase [Candidatus Kariarchaeaceae archaeon]|jgi:small GTP-binding protein